MTFDLIIMVGIRNTVSNNKIIRSSDEIMPSCFWFVGGCAVSLDELQNQGGLMSLPFYHLTCLLPKAFWGICEIEGEIDDAIFTTVQENKVCQK
jgi:hypothetical protein